MGSIDADAHVIESEATFTYMDPDYARLTPIPVTRRESGNAEFGFEGQTLNDYWVVEGVLDSAEEDKADKTMEQRGQGVNKHVYWVTENLLEDWI